MESIKSRPGSLAQRLRPCQGPRPTATPPPRIEQECNHENEPSQDHLVVGADKGRQIPNWTHVGLNGAALAPSAAFSTVRSARAFASTVSLVGEAVALGLPSFTVRGAWRLPQGLPRVLSSWVGNWGVIHRQEVGSAWPLGRWKVEQHAAEQRSGVGADGANSAAHWRKTSIVDSALSA